MIKREDRKKQITEQRQEQILGAAIRVFAGHGFEGATIPDIAGEAGVAVGTIYNYYNNKRELLLAAVIKFAMQSFENIINRPDYSNEADLISAIIEDRLNLGLENIERFLALFSDIRRDPELRRIYTGQIIHPVMAKMESFVASKIREGAFRDMSPSVVTRALGGMVIGFMIFYSMEGESSPVHGADRKKLADDLTKLVLEGLRMR
jgi:AcrR family transcriptional regulator